MLVISCQHDVEHSQDAEGDGLQTWKCAANVSDKQSQIPRRNDNPVWGVQQYTNAPLQTIKHVKKCYAEYC
jgi:hypothetical protein